jgi:hypothetical protein
MTEVKDISTETKTCKIHENNNGQYIVEFIDGELNLLAGAFSTLDKAEESGNQLLLAECITKEMLVGDIVPTETPAETPL